MKSQKIFSMDCEFLLMVVLQSHYDYLGGVCCRSIVFEIFRNAKSAFLSFLFLD